MKAIGIERSPPRTTAAREPRTTRVKTMGSRLKSGEIRIPPSPASTVVSTQATAEVFEALTPFRPARCLRSTTARISRPIRVCRSTTHRASAATNAATNTANWSEVRATPCMTWNTLAGVGPSPGVDRPWLSALFPTQPMWKMLLPRVTTTHCMKLGMATSRPMVPTTLA